MYSLRWFAADWHKRSLKLLDTGVCRIFGVFPPHITGRLLGKSNSGLQTLIQLIYVLYSLNIFFFQTFTVVQFQIT
jgi:hypothetical protein